MVPRGDEPIGSGQQSFDRVRLLCYLDYGRACNRRYYRARYYHPQLQRFISEDSLEFEGGDVNLYVYVGNDPTDLIDPLGLYSYDEFVYDSAQFSAGFGDTVSFGLTGYIRRLWGFDAIVDRCSGLYAAGMYTELGVEAALTGGSFALRGAAKGITQAAARRGLSSGAARGVKGISELHHVNPLKSGLFPTAALPAAISSRQLEPEAPLVG